MMNDIAGILESSNLPGWFPDDIREHALKCQRNLLRRHGMTLDTLREAVEEIIEVHREHFTDPNYAIYEYRSMTIRDGKPDFADPDRAILARYLYAATLDEKDGLPLLIGNDHAGQVIHGKKFPGRKPGSIGPVRKFIRARLAKNHAATNEELWDAIKAKPPKGWTPMDTTKFGRYIDGPPGSDEVKWKSFCSYAALERKRLKIHD